MATVTDKPSSADASLEPNPNQSIDLTSVPTSDNSNGSPSAVIPNSDGLLKDGDGSASAKVSAAESGAAQPVTDVEKKIRRAERFGITVQLSEQEKRNSRAERFGTPAGSGSGSGAGAGSTVNNSEELKRKARAERFGLPVTSDEDMKKKARLERFAPTSKKDEVEEQKKKARELRFSQPSKTHSMNGKGDIEPKAAISGKAGGGA